MSPAKLGRLAAPAALVATLVVTASAGARPQVNSYSVATLVSDSNDASLVNPWGLVAGPTTPWWTANNKTNTSTLYNGAGAKQALTVTVPGGPTGIVFNGSSTDFPVTQGSASAVSRFIFSTEAGMILGWSPTVNRGAAVMAVDHSGAGAVYKGLTVANDRLYATDFHNGRVDVFDATFAPVAAPFKDPKLPKGYAPFGIAALGSNIFVTYAQQDSARKDDVPGGGRGYVDEFSPDGQLMARVARGGRKNAPPDAPWGLALAPASFGAFAGDLLVGNFGDGRISAYRDNGGGHWVYKGQLRSGNGSLVVIDGLWALAFGNGSAGGPVDSLFFTAGPQGEAHGAFGAITAG
jgi:uncharacterized protein (TIGR03118 family)